MIQIRQKHGVSATALLPCQPLWRILAAKVPLPFDLLCFWNCHHGTQELSFASYLTCLCDGCRSPLLPRGQLSQPAAQTVNGKQAGAWAPAMPATPQQVKLKPRTLAWSGGEENVTQVQNAATTHVNPVEEPTLRYPSAAHCF